MTKVAYYKGCLASLSAKELDTSTQALAPMLDLELDELESVTCCGAGDIHEAEPDYYLHLNARILAYAAATGAETLMTICNVCTLNLRQANFQLVNDPELRARVNTNLATVGVPPYEDDIDVKHLLWLIVEDDGAERLRKVAHKGLKGLRIAPFYGCQILRPSKLLGFEDPDRPWSLEAIIEACGGEAIDYPAKIKCCGFARRLAVEAEGHDGPGLQDADPASIAARRRRCRARGVRAQVQAPRGLGRPCAREARGLSASKPGAASPGLAASPRSGRRLRSWSAS